MSQYYRDLHDRELLSQAESILFELNPRRQIQVRVPSSGWSDKEERICCSLDSTVCEGNRLSLVVNRRFERPAEAWHEAVQGR
jgi:hypothetical protein